jgi:hypothetical protein
VAQTPKRVAFVSEQKLEDHGSCFNESLDNIVSLCTTLAKSAQEPCELGFLKCSNGYRHEFYTNVPDSIDFSKQSLSISQLLQCENQDDGRRREQGKVSREIRKRLSVQISKALLLLFETPWIDGEWSKNEIIFKDLGEGVPSVYQPYLRRRFATTTGTRKDTKRIVYRLGVLLLELCLGQTLSNYYHGEQMKMLEFVAAYNCCMQNVNAQEGPEVAEVIRKCLAFDFATRSKCLEDEDLVKAMYNEVVRPLNEALGDFRVD